MIEVKRSRIHGYGVFATANISYAAMIPNPAFAKCRGWKLFGGFNSACVPNGVVDHADDEVHATKKIYAGDEITLSYIVRECMCPDCKK